MEFTLKEILAALGGSTAIIGGLWIGIKFIYERLDTRKKDKQTATEKAYEQIWKLYEAAKKENAELKKEIDDSEKNDPLSREKIRNLHSAASKLRRQIEILDSLFIKEFVRKFTNPEKQQLAESIKREMEILWQRFSELEKSLP